MPVCSRVNIDVLLALSLSSSGRPSVQHEEASRHDVAVGPDGLGRRHHRHRRLQSATGQTHALSYFERKWLRPLPIRDSFVKDPAMHVLSPRRISRWIMAFREKSCPCGKAMAGRKGSNGTAFARREGEIRRDGIGGPLLMDHHDLGAKRVSLFFTTFHSVCPSARPYMLASLLL